MMTITTLNNNNKKKKNFNNAFKSDSLSNSVSELVIPSIINDVKEEAAVSKKQKKKKKKTDNDESLLVVFNNNNDNNNNIPTLNLDTGLLSPSSLLLGYNDDHNNTTSDINDEEDDDIMICKFLNSKENYDDGDDDMLMACRNLQIAAAQATIEISKIIDYHEKHNNILSLTPRVELAFKLLTIHQENKNNHRDGDDHDDYYYYCNYSSVQLLFAEMDYLLESIAPDDDDKAGNWRSRDLMQNGTVRSILGLPLSLILHLLAGPLNGVCLRNLVWHGYVGPVEVEYWSNLLWMIVALGMLPRCNAAVVANSTIKTSVVPNNDPLSVVDIIEDYVPSDEVIMKLLEASSPQFLPPYLHPIFREAMRLCRSILHNQHKSKEKVVGTYWRVLAMLYTILERGLRGLYVVKNFPTNDSILLAHTNILHITMATILQSTIENDDDDSSSNNDDSVEGAVSTPSIRRPTNKLLTYLGDGPVAALYDEFVWIGLPDASWPGTSSTFSGHNCKEAMLEPLPCRNELVHGTLSLEGACIPRVMTRVVKVTIGLAAITSTKKTLIENDPHIHRCQEWLEEYQPRRHPTLQLWRKFRVVCCGEERNQHKLEGMVQSHLPPFSLAPQRRSQDAIFDTSDDGLSVLQPMTIEYCSVCSLPYEYCCYTSSAVKCIEGRYCTANSTSLTSVLWLTHQVLNRLATAGSCVEEEEDATVLSRELEKARCMLMPIVVSSSGYETSNDDEVIDWSFLNESPARRGSAENELAKLWMIREAVVQCDNLIQRSYRWLLEAIARISCGETTMRVGKKKKPISMLVRRLLITLQACEVLLLMSLEQYHARDVTSNVLSTFLSTVANTLATHLHERRLSLCLALAAGLIGQSDLFMSELPKSDRTKFLFNFRLYVDYAVRGTEPFNVHAMITHKYSLGPSAYQKSRSGADWATLRRWQTVSE